MTRKKTASPVYFWNLRASSKAPYDLRVKRLLKLSKVSSLLRTGDLVAVKTHFGERGTTGFVAPLQLKPIVDFLRKSGAKPFLTDTNTLYVGQRGESVSHALLAAEHGFDPMVTGAPVIISDGLKSSNQVSITGPGQHFEHAYLAGDILDADFLITVSHFKGHDLSGYGGVLKNLGMGCATRQGKMQQHCGLGPRLNPERCIQCGDCVEVCSPGALSLNEDGTMVLDQEACIGCAACLLTCRHGGLSVNWDVDLRQFMEKMIEYAGAVLSCFAHPPLHITFLQDVTPGCDCIGYSDAPVCPDIGVLASYDPVALDSACLDLVNQAPCLHPSRLPPECRPGMDKFTALHPRARHEHGLDYAQSLGLGLRTYQLVPTAPEE
jgi:hypothetical protein